MFEILFAELGKAARQEVSFAHIHPAGCGIRTITVDMCMKQAPGMA